MSFEEGFIKDTIKRLRYYKDLGDKTFAQLDEPDFFYQPHEVSNSIAIIVQHMHGNMLSRWTNLRMGEREIIGLRLKCCTYCFRTDQGDSWESL